MPTNCFRNDADLKLPEAWKISALVLLSLDDATHIAVFFGDLIEILVKNVKILAEAIGRINLMSNVGLLQ